MTSADEEETTKQNKGATEAKELTQTLKEGDQRSQGQDKNITEDTSENKQKQTEKLTYEDASTKTRVAARESPKKILPQLNKTNDLTMTRGGEERTPNLNLYKYIPQVDIEPAYHQFKVEEETKNKLEKPTKVEIIQETVGVENSSDIIMQMEFKKLLKGKQDLWPLLDRLFYLTEVNFFTDFLLLLHASWYLRLRRLVFPIVFVYFLTCPL